MTRAERLTLQVATQLRRYLLIPANRGVATGPATGAEAGQLPTIVLLHGSSQDGAGMRKAVGASFESLAERGLAHIAYPDGIRRRWNHAESAEDSNVDDVEFMRSLVSELQGKFGSGDVIFAGYSNGGQLLIRLLHEAPEIMAGAVIISATLPRSFNIQGPLHAADLGVPVMLVHGTRDFVVSYQGEGRLPWNLGRSAGPSAPQTATYFAKRNGIAGPALSRVLPHRQARDKTSVALTEYREADKAPVSLFTVFGGGHVIPTKGMRLSTLAGRTTQDLDVVEEMIKFFGLDA